MSVSSSRGLVTSIIICAKTDTEVFMNRAVPRMDYFHDYLHYKHKLKDKASLMLSYFLDNREKIARC